MGGIYIKNVPGVRFYTVDLDILGVLAVLRYATKNIDIAHEEYGTTFGPWRIHRGYILPFF